MKQSKYIRSQERGVRMKTFKVATGASFKPSAILTPDYSLLHKLDRVFSRLDDRTHSRLHLFAFLRGSDVGESAFYPRLGRGGKDAARGCVVFEARASLAPSNHVNVPSAFPGRKQRRPALCGKY